MSKIYVPFGELHEAIFVERPNRFIVQCQLVCDNSIVRAHLADPGRLKEILVPGRSLWLRPSKKPERTTKWSAVLAEDEVGTFISLDSTLPNRLIRQALKQNAIAELAEWEFERAEYALGKSRWDFLLNRGGKKLILEVKSVTLCNDGIGRFPDAITQRGRKHLQELTHLVEEKGTQTAVLFVAGREDIVEIRPADHIDPQFAIALVQAKQCGVRVLGRHSFVSKEGITLGKGIPVFVGEDDRR